MLSVRDIPLIVYRLLKKERQGSTVSISDMNRFIKLAHLQEVDAIKRQLEVTQDVTDSVRVYLNSEAKAMTAWNYLSIADLSQTYLKLLGAQRKNGVRWEECDVITQLEYQDRIGNSITQPTVDYPICYELGSVIYFLPTPEAGASVRVSYMSRPIVPYVDGYINLAGELVYLEESETVSTGLIDADFINYGWDGIALSVTEGIYTSLTVEFDWPDNSNRINILKRVLIMCGVSVPDTLAIQYGGGGQ